MAHLFFLSISMALFITSTQSQPTDPSYYYNLCAPSSCGNLSSIKYPFALPTPCRPRYMHSLCRNNETLTNTVNYTYYSSNNETYRILSLDYTNTSTLTLFIAADSLFTCGAPISKADYQVGARLPGFQLGSGYNTLGTHLNCTAPVPPGLIPGMQTAPCLGCDGQDPENICYYAPGFVTAPNCEIFYICTPNGPFNASGVGNLRAYLQKGYEARFIATVTCSGCEASGGRCGSNPFSELESEFESDSFLCFCKSSVHPMNCSDGMAVDLSDWVNKTRNGGSKSSTTIIAAIVIPSSIFVLVVSIVLLVLYFSKWRHTISIGNTFHSEISLRRYSYAQLKMFTDDFSVKLGGGGFGNVYKGKIHQSGCTVHVAVKVLKKSMQTKKQFMSEITTAGSIHHDNLVWMLGYCSEADTHALVYEFMENKSLDKHIYRIRKQTEAEDKSATTSGNLNFKQSYNIALQTARGILYLHNGCSKKILHCDIKPANVLLDSNFSAKIADFGLSRMCGKDHSHVSLTGAQGTPGYAAPEIWLKTIGPVTEKSDVYSYGMLILEMIGRRKNYDDEAPSSNQVYFPEWLYNNIVSLESPSMMRKSCGGNSFETAWNDESWNEEEERIFQRICLVGLWCIQYMPSNRPSMYKVIQMLEGNVEIGIPMHPFPQQSFTGYGSKGYDEHV